MVTTARERFLFWVFLATVGYSLILVSWNQGYDYGYATGMADSLINEKAPEEFFKR